MSGGFKIQHKNITVKGFLRESRAFFAEDADNIARFNISMLKIMTVVYLLIIVCYAIFVSVIGTDVRMRDITLGAIVAQILFCCFVHFADSRFRLSSLFIQNMCSFFGVLMLVYILLLDVIVFRNKTTFLYPLILVCMTQIYTLPLIRNVWFVGFFAVLYLVLSYFVNEPAIFLTDAIAILTGVSIAYSATFALSYFKLSEYQSRKKYLHLSSIDLLTDVSNKVVFRDMTQKRLNALKPGGHALLFIFDLDNFKKANDTHGHAKGDEMLITFGEAMHRLNDELGETILIGRFGGDEFTLYADNVCGIEKYVAEVQSRLYAMLDGAFTFTTGVALTDGNIKDYDSLFYIADRALLKAKSSNKGGYALTDTAVCADASNIGTKKSAADPK